MEFFDLIHQQFMQRALLSGLLVGVFGAVGGIFLALRREALYSDAISHSVLTGIAIGILLSISPLLLALIVGVIVSITITYLKNNTQIYSDSLIAIIYTSLFSLGVILIASYEGYRPDLETYLFGNLLAVSWGEIFLLAVFLIGFTLFITKKYKQILYFIFDPDAAKIRGIRVGVYDYVLNIALTIGIILSLSSVGIILVTGLLIIPASMAKLFAKQFADMFPISIIHNVVAVLVGIIFFTNSPPGPAIILVSAILFFSGFICKQLLERRQ